MQHIALKVELIKVFSSFSDQTSFKALGVIQIISNNLAGGWYTEQGYQISQRGGRVFVTVSRDILKNLLRQFLKGNFLLQYKKHSFLKNENFMYYFESLLAPSSLSMALLSF
jgi:hypothetical protein